jgi:hypothetical protein
MVAVEAKAARQAFGRQRIRAAAVSLALCGRQKSDLHGESRGFDKTMVRTDRCPGPEFKGRFILNPDDAMGTPVT